MPLWGKVRVANGGDRISTAFAQERHRGAIRDASFVRVRTPSVSLTPIYLNTYFQQYEMNVDRNARHRNAPIDFQRVVFYARLEQIIECTIPANNTLQLKSPKLFLLALVTDCITDGGDATTDAVTYTAMKSSSSLIDLNAIQCVVGRLELGVSQRRWGIVDRSEDWAHTTFKETDMGDAA